MKLSELARATLLSIGLIPVSVMADGVSELNEDLNIRSYARVTGQFQHSTSGGNGYLGDAWMPLFGSARSASFVNLQAYDYANQYRTYGAGIGHRHAVGNTVLGGYAFYDKQYSANNNAYDRYTVGAEMLGQRLQARANYYWFGQPNQHQLQDLGTTASVQGNDIVLRQTLLNELAYGGGDAELGYSISPAITVYTGGYYYSEKLSGYKARVRYRFAGHVELTAATQHDQARGWLTTVSLGYWLGKPFSEHNTVLDRLRDNIVRDMTVATTEQTSTVDTVADTHVYFVGNGTSENLTENEQELSFAEAVSKASEGDIIFVNYGNGSEIALNGAVTLNVPNLTVLTTASGLTLQLNGQNYELIKADATKMPNLGGGAFVVEAPTKLADFNLDGTNSTVADGIDIEHAGAVTVQNVNVSNYSGAGIEVDGAENQVNLINVSSNENGEDGLTVGRTSPTGAGAQVIVQNSEFSRNQGFGVYAEGANTEVTLHNSLVDRNVDVNNISHGLGALSGASISAQNVTLLSDTSLGNTRLLEVGGGNAAITFNGGVIKGAANKLTALVDGGEITITNPTELVGNLRVIASTTFPNDKVVVNLADGQSFTADSNDKTIKCNYPTDNPACV